MRLDQFLKSLTPFTQVEIVIMSKEKFKLIQGYKISVIESFGDKQNGDDTGTTGHIQIIAKEEY